MRNFRQRRFDLVRARHPYYRSLSVGFDLEQWAFGVVTNVYLKTLEVYFLCFWIDVDL
jgi:hypothetical protein